MKLVMGTNTIIICSSFLIFVFVASIFAFSASQNNGFLAYATPGKVIDSLEFEESFVDRTAITHVSGDIFAIVYDGNIHDGAECEGCLQTVLISPSGSISLIDLQEFNDDVERVHITKVSDNVVAIVYQEDSDSDGYLKTVGIDSDGTITGVIETLEFDTSNAFVPYIIHASGDVFAIVYGASDNDSVLTTVDINSDGTIDGVLATFEFETVDDDNDDQSTHIITHVSGDIFAIVYDGDNEHSGAHCEYPALRFGKMHEVFSGGFACNRCYSSCRFKSLLLDNPM